MRRRSVEGTRTHTETAIQRLPKERDLITKSCHFLLEERHIVLGERIASSLIGGCTSSRILVIEMVVRRYRDCAEVA